MTKYRAMKDESCLGKDKLPSMALARDVARQVSKRRDSAIVPYKCIHCGFYHVGSNSRLENRYVKRR